MPNKTQTAATTTAKASKIHDPMLTLQRAVAYIVLFVLCFICLFFFYVLIVNATHNNFTIQQGFDPLPRGSFGVNFFNTTHDANVPILTGLRNSLIVSAACAALSVYFSALTAYAIYLTGLKVPDLVASMCSFIGQTTSPLIMLITGSALALMPLRKVFTNGKLYMMYAVKLVILPVCAYFLLRALGVDSMLLGVIVVVLCIPSATSATNIAYLYGGNHELASSGVMLSTLLSMVTMPLLMHVLFG